MVTLPYRSEREVSLPQVVRSYGNGRIPRELLQPCGIRSFLMVEPAARACRAMVTAAAADGVRLDATGTYRSYDQQVALFTSRYSKTALSGRPTKTWNRVRYWQMPNTAMAATPGTSNHGLGITGDLAQRSASGALEPVGTATLTWLAAHGPAFGFWNSVRSEAWHWPYFLGDNVPSAVLEMEQSGAIRLPPAVPSDPAKREAFYRELPRTGVLSKGSRGPAVEAVQWALTRAGIPTGIDGDFGPATERSVREFQGAKRLTVDGLVGPATWSRLGLLVEGKEPQENATRPAGKKKAAKAKAAKKTAGKKKRAAKKKASAKKTKPAPTTPAPQHGAIVAATAAYRAGFRGDDVATITMIAGRESRWRSDQINPRTSDRGMWQINWKNLQAEGYNGLRERLGITSDADLLDLDTNAAVAFFMYEDAIRFGEPWFPWRGSEKGHDGKGPAWDPKGSHTWHTEDFAAEATAAAKVAIKSKGKGKPDVRSTPPAGERSTPPPESPSSYTIGRGDADGIIAVVSRCLGLTDAPWPLRSASAEAVAEHNGATLDRVWKVGDEVQFPAEIDGVRSYTVRPGDGMIAIATGLGLGRSKAAQGKATAINSWQGSTPHAGVTWYGGPE